MDSRRSPVGPAVLIICDGWGITDATYGNAIAAAKTPTFDRWLTTLPHTRVAASGEAVGLPAGQQGNSEVGHLTIGAGRVIWQPLSLISRAIEDGSFFSNPELCRSIDRAIERKKALHCLGLVSPGGVHSDQRHGIALAKLAAQRGLERVFFHAFTDGRDEPPKSAARYVADFCDELRAIGVGNIASVSGRYYAMDRDKRWERTARAYGAITGGDGAAVADAIGYIEQQYAEGISDEFINPARIVGAAPIDDGDSIIFWNFRPDRARQLCHALVDQDFADFPRRKVLHDVALTTFTEYEKDLPVSVAFPRQDVKQTLGEVIAEAGLSQFRIAETEKYAHVTYFINGGREDPFADEERTLIPSLKVPTYDSVPQMRAAEITQAVTQRLQSNSDALLVINFANPDMVGHTGDFAATVKAVEFVDSCLGDIEAVTLAKGGFLLMTADHGNAEMKIDARDGSPLTAHTTAEVPVVISGADIDDLRRGGGLCDIAPTILGLLQLPIPEVMTGKSLVSSRGHADAAQQSQD